MREKKTIPTKQFPREIVIFFLLVISVFALFYPAVHYDFVNYDDADYVSANFQVQRGLTQDGFIWAFTTGHMGNWHPLTWLSHMLDVEIFGTKPSGQHFTNIFFHAINTLLLFVVLKRMTRALWRSAFVAALFALHPLHVESVAWISERKDVLSMFFWMLALWTYAKYVKKRAAEKGRKGEKSNDTPLAYFPTHSLSHFLFYFLALAFFALGLMSKPMVVTLPFVLLLLDIWPLNRLSKVQSPNSKSEEDFKAEPLWPLDFRLLPRLLFEKIPFFALAFAASITTFIVQKGSGAVSTLAEIPLILRFENAIVSYLRYILKTFWPTELSVIYPRQDEWPFWLVAVATLSLLAISAFAIWSARRRPYFFVGWFWFVGMLVPVIGLVQVGSQSMADRYTYIPLIGLFIAVTWTVTDIFSRWNFPKIALGFCAGIVLVCCAAVAKTQISYWKDTESLFRRAIEVTDKNYIAYNALGYFLSQKGRFDEAIEAHQKSLEIAPGFASAHVNFGIALAGIGKHDEAMEHYATAVRLDPDNPEAHNNLGIAFVMRGNIESAVKHFRAACKINPDYLAALNGLAWILATHPNPKFRNGTEAVHLASRAVELTNERDAGIFETLAAAYAESGDFPNAQKLVQRAMVLGNAGTDTLLKSRLTAELQMYQANQPHRDSSFKEN